MVKGIASWEFPKEQSLEETNQNLELRNILIVRPPPYEKNKLHLNEYLGDFMHFETIYFFFAGNDFFKPSHPTKVRKIPHFFFETFPYSECKNSLF